MISAFKSIDQDSSTLHACVNGKLSALL